ncbi:NAD(P)H-binding protein [Rhizohabitans arisaemae]|uniref:NAD(P)H-binding protein n=1 Tax=Rhizohabitans arisaemae TaxID=2720610 RepID=UPI0024B1B76C|nr:NAD(P)H-binding protein [Rhizohabitans arisaemae]
MILVTGATGKVGGQAVAQLVELGADVRVLSRDPQAARFPSGVEVARGDLADAGSLDAALTGVGAVFLVWPTLQADHAATAVIGEITRRVPQVVYLSSAGAADGDRRPTDPINLSHTEIERLIRESGAAWTFLRAGGFAANDLGWAPEIRQGGVVREPFGGWARSLVHEADLAAVGVRALIEEGHAGVAYHLTGPEALTQAQRVQTLGEVIGRPLRFEELTPEQAREYFLAWLPPDTVDDTLKAMAEATSQPEPVTGLVEQVTGRPARTYRQWVIDHAGDFASPGRPA